MKRHCAGGKSACERKAVKICVLFFFVSLSVSAQTFTDKKIPTFAVEKFPTFSGYSKIAVFNIDDEPPYDIIFYGNDRNEFVYHSQKNLAKARRKFFFYPVTEIKLLAPSSNPDKRLYIFVSRKNKLVGLASFTKYGTLRLLNRKRIADYPEKILVGNFLGNRKLRALVFGNNFSGVSLFSEEDFILNETKVIENGCFSEGGLVDADADGMNDLVLFSNLEEKLNFYLNLLNKFEITTTQKIGLPIYNFKTCDVNGDKLLDYAFVADDEIRLNIVRTNPDDVKRINIGAPRCKDYVFSDFTFDYKKDLFALNKNGEIFYSINNGKNNFGVARKLTTIGGGVALNTFWNKNKREIVALSRKGFFVKFSPVNKIDTTTSVLLNDIKRNSLPLILRKRNSTDIYWLSGTLAEIYSMNIGSSGKIKTVTKPIPFFASKLIRLNNKIFLYAKSDSTEILLDAFGRNASPLLINSQNISFTQNAIVLNDSAKKIILPPDTLQCEFDFEKLIAGFNGKFVFYGNDSLHFAVRKKGNLLVKTKRVAVNKGAKVFPYFENSAQRAVIIAERNSVTAISPDTLFSFRTNKNFSKSDYLFYKFIDGKNDLLFALSADGTRLYKTRIRANKKHLTFVRTVFQTKLKTPLMRKIDGKIYLCGYNEKNKTIDFTELR